MKCATEMVSGGMICILSFMMIGSGIQETLRLLYQHFERINIGVTNGVYEECHWDGLR
jgi:hypothetical protein